jgi:hypothetical protein
VKGTKKYRGYNYAVPIPELIPPGKGGEYVNMVDKKTNNKKSVPKRNKFGRIRSSKIDHPYEGGD